MSTKRGQGKLRLNAMLNAMMLRELMDGPCTAADLQAVTGTSRITITQYLMAMHRKGCIRIAGWERDSSNKQSIRVFEFGHGPDAPKQPKPKAGEIQRATELRNHFRAVQRMAA